MLSSYLHALSSRSLLARRTPVNRGNSGARPRVLCLIARYPQFSETYMHEELTAVARHHDVTIVSYLNAYAPRKRCLPYHYVPYLDADINWGRFDDVNLEFDNSEQKQFLKRMARLIKKARPDVLHGHYLGTGLLLRKLSDIHGIPFTLRTHSFDMLQKRPGKIAAICRALDCDRLLRVFTYPEFKGTLVAQGLTEMKVTSVWPVVKVSAFRNRSRSPGLRRVLCTGPSVEKKGHDQFIDLAKRMRRERFTFNLYTRGHFMPPTIEHNRKCGNPVSIRYADPEDMPKVYADHDWLVYPTKLDLPEVGLPVSVIEAQASGLGVCLQAQPGREKHQLDFLGGGGHLFRSIDEVPEIIRRPYSEGMRELGYVNAEKCGVEKHCAMLSKAWGQQLRL